MIIGLIGVSKLQNSSNSEIDVKDFGAIGDGITDDTLVTFVISFLTFNMAKNSLRSYSNLIILNILKHDMQ